MIIARLSVVLRLCRWLVVGTLFAAGLQLVMLLAEANSVSSQPEVRLSLDTTRPALLGLWFEMQRGWEAGGPAPHPAPRALPKPHLAVGRAFVLEANPAAPLLRYQEASAPRRIALLALGAWSGGLSVAGLLLMGMGGWLLLQLLRDVTPATPFTAANARRLLQLSLLVFGLNLWEYVARIAVLALVPSFRTGELLAPLNQYVRLNTDDLVPGFWVGFMLLIISAVYQRGVELSREAELVI